jgi:hypothetical protein
MHVSAAEVMEEVSSVKVLEMALASGRKPNGLQGL